MRFRVIDNKTGKEADICYYRNSMLCFDAGMSPWGLAQFMLTQDNKLYIVHEYGQKAYCRPEIFTVEWIDE